MVYVLDKRKKPLMPCSLKHARQLLDRGRARVHKRCPFTIRLVDRFEEDLVLQPLTLKIDPGSKTTGMALVREAGPKAEPKAEVVSLIELKHRGEEINKKLKQRAAFRRRRRSTNLRYRAPRLDNRRPKKGWLPPSLQHRVDSTLSRRKPAPVLGSCDCHRPGCGPNRSMASRSEIKAKPWFPKATSRGHISDEWRRGRLDRSTSKPLPQPSRASTTNTATLSRGVMATACHLVSHFQHFIRKERACSPA
jgi:RRXRR protein